MRDLLRDETLEWSLCELPLLKGEHKNVHQFQMCVQGQI